MSAVSMVYERCPFLAEAVAPARQPWFDAASSTPSWHAVVAEAGRSKMVEVYERTGGLARSDEVLFMLRRRTSQPLSMLARWIVDRRVVSFEWLGQRYLPMFQFERADMSIHPGVVPVLAELAGTFDEWELAVWFAEPNAWLHGRCPVEALESDAQAVVDAARADRFVARG